MAIRKGRSSRPKITKKYILDRISEEEIFEYYLGFKVEFGKDFRNPTRNDNHAGCRFYISSSTGRLRFNDFGKKNYDCFDIACQEEKVTFKEVLSIIASRFGLIDKPVDDLKRPKRVIRKEEPKELIVKTRSLTNEEVKYFSQYYIDKDRLKKFYVYGLKWAYLKQGNRVLRIYQNKRELAFTFPISPTQWKIYFPERNKKRFYQLDGKTLQGIYLLPKEGDDLVYTKSYKDVIALDIFGIKAVAPQSESIRFDRDTMIDLYNRFNNHYHLFDNDFAGKRYTIRNIKEYPYITPLLFSRGTYEKDFTDNLKVMGVDKMKQLIERVKYDDKR